MSDPDAPTVAPAVQRQTDEQSDAPLYPMQGEPVVVWAIDSRRWDGDPQYRDAVTDFVYSRIPGASLRTVKVLQDDTGQLVLAAFSALHADGSFRGRTPGGGLVRQPVVVPLPADVQLPT